MTKQTRNGKQSTTTMKLKKPQACKQKQPTSNKRVTSELAMKQKAFWELTCVPEE